jgi:DUF4097 and DUF4098 domain-containing protein YvlB
MLRQFRFALAASALAFLACGCGVGPGATGSFERTLTVTGPIRLDLSTASGDVVVTGGAQGEVQIHATVRAHGWFFQDAQKQLNEVVSNPPIEQRLDSIRIGKDFNDFRNVSIDYNVEVPDLTEVDLSVASGSVIVRRVHGPVSVDSASGAIRIEQVAGSVKINSASGSTNVSDLGDDLRVSTASGSVNVTSVKGSISVDALSSSIDISNPGSRVDANTASGSINVSGANNDVRAASASGGVTVTGNPSGNAYWNLKTASGGVTINVPSNATFYLTADAVSGDIRTSMPIVVEEQGRHALRARVGAGGGRVEIHTISGAINIQHGS